MHKQQLLDQIRSERAAWDALLGQVGAERMELPGVTGDWTMKATIAHLTTWWRREVARLAAAQREERPPDHPPQTDVAIINDWIYLTNHDRPVADVLHDAQVVWEQFEAIVASLPENILCEQERFTWMQGRSLGMGIFEDFTGHFHGEHEPLIRQWLTQQAGG